MSQYRGYVDSIVLHKAIGFLRVPDQPVVFFSAHDLRGGLAFDEQLRERYVRFQIITTARGSKAIEIEPAE